MTHDEFVDLKKREIVSVANSMLSGEVNLIEGVRQICDLRTLIDDPENKVFLPLVGFESETDIVPVGDARTLWASDSLQMIDKEVEKYLLKAREFIFRSCREIVRLYSD